MRRKSCTPGVAVSASSRRGAVEIVSPPRVTIEKARPGQGKGFKPAAQGKRGVTAWVEREGVLRLGDEVKLLVPTQRAWAGNRAPDVE